MTAAATALEIRIGRLLTAAEQHIAVEAIDELLNRAKDDLEQAILTEQRRLARLIARGHTGRLDVTDAMLVIVRRLRRAGQGHARAELNSMGYPLRRAGRSFASDAEFEARLRGRLRGRLRRLGGKVEQAAVGLDLAGLSRTAIERELIRVLGARSIAADLISPVFVSGLADTFEAHADLVEAWQYTAVNDSGLCDQCAPHDGEEFASLDELFAVLPGFGPNPECLGGDRCRCRAVPVPPSSEPATLAA